MGAQVPDLPVPLSVSEWEHGGAEVCTFRRKWIIVHPLPERFSQVGGPPHNRNRDITVRRPPPDSGKAAISSRIAHHACNVLEEVRRPPGNGKATGLRIRERLEHVSKQGHQRRRGGGAPRDLANPPASALVGHFDAHSDDRRRRRPGNADDVDVKKGAAPTYSVGYISLG